MLLIKTGGANSDTLLVEEFHADKFNATDNKESIVHQEDKKKEPQRTEIQVITSCSLKHRLIVPGLRILENIY
jgi:hypothetical protein